MYDYIKGIVKKIEANYLVIENNNIGYLIYMANPYSVKLDEEITIYLYNHIREDENLLYGFLNPLEKELFLKLINVKGLGPKMALPMLATGSISGIKDAIERENILYLTKFPKIGEKLARQIILDLKGKLVSQKEDITVGFEELKEVLNGLGYKPKDYNKILVHIDKDLTIEEQVKEALKLLLK